MKVCNFDYLCCWLYDYSLLIERVKVTKIKPIGFNTTEGNRYICNVKIIAKKGYKNRILSFYINSSYLDDSLEEISIGALNKYLNNCL